MSILFALLLAAGSDRCASAALCPSDSDLKTVVRAQDNATYNGVQSAVSADGQGGVVTIPFQIIRRISNVRCGAPSPDSPQTVFCKFAAVRGTETEYWSGSLKRTGDGWAMSDAKVVVRRR